MFLVFLFKDYQQNYEFGLLFITKQKFFAYVF